MKLLILPLLLAVAGLFRLDARSAPEDCPDDCEVSVECVDEDTCLVTCRDAEGNVVCEIELDCDAPCASAGAAAMPASACAPASTCAPAGNCAR